jgi:Zn-dependent metalloprotease
MAIGKEKAEKIFYLVMTQYLRPTSTFAQAAASTKTACKQLFTKPVCDQVKASLAAVGL